MTPKEQRERVIQNLAKTLRHSPFVVEFKVKKKPKGIKIIYEVTEEQMKVMVNHNKK